ncbi:hypothetical protein JRO89_XS03G0137700 [Xanthoceras sorbifolium]|uniref:ENTH domain-containing protein n=1 Tax=Xanthoceras sorbifolium TaxID=99658 RepID=A0ABQ8IAD6_9ROSI|nr:hypothetical protein JRO89_XS03G0137700 [Xanthoceras sorbifolium]
MKKAFDQTFRDIKRGVNKKVLKVPGIEQKVLDATSNEPWGPHGTLLADVAQATRNYHEYQMIMSVIWKRINDTGKNWRHVYKALTVLEYLVAHGSERVIEEIREHSYQISTLSDFQYIDSSGRDQGSNVRKKSQSLVALVNDKERIVEVRQKAAANRDKFRNTPTGGMYKPGSYSGSGGYGDKYDYDRSEGRYGSRDDEQNGYGRERDYGYRDDDRYDRNGDSYSRDGDRYGRDYEDRYGRDGYRDDDYRGRSRSVDRYQDGSGRSSDRYRSFDDDGQTSSRGSGARADDHSVEGRQLERKFSEQNIGAPPSYEEALSESRSPSQSERDGETATVSVPRTSSAPTLPSASSPPAVHNPSQATNALGSTSPVNQEVVTSDDFDPRGSPPALGTMSNNAAPTTTNCAAPSTSNNTEIDLLGSLSDSFSSDALAIMPVTASITTEAEAPANSGSGPTYTVTQLASNTMNQFKEKENRVVNGRNQKYHQQAGHRGGEWVIEDAELRKQYKVDDDLYNLKLIPELNMERFELCVSLMQSFEDPFGDSPFKAIPSTDTALAQPQTAAFPAPFHPTLNQNAEMTQPAAPKVDTVPDFGDSLYGITYSAQSASNVQPSPNSQFLPQELSTSQQETDILADILPPSGPSPPVASQVAFSTATGQPAGPGANMYGGFQPQPVSSNIAPQMPYGSAAQFSGGNFIPQGSSTAPVMNPQTLGGPAAQFNSGNFLPHQGSAVPPPSQIAYQTPSAAQQNSDLLNNFLPQAGPNPSMASQPDLQSSTGSLAIVPLPQPSKDKFEPKSAVWADTLSRGLVNFNISGPKTNPLADIGVDFDAINRKEKRMEKQPAQAPVSTITMGKAMGSGSGMGRAGASVLRPPPNPVMGVHMQPQMGMPPGSTMQGGYRPMTAFQIECGGSGLRLGVDVVAAANAVSKLR